MIKMSKYKKKQKYSPVWKYYEEKGKDAAICKLCGNTYSRKGRCTSALKSHIRCKHPDEYLTVCAAYKLLECKPNDYQEKEMEVEVSRELNNTEIGVEESDTLQIRDIKCEPDAETEPDQDNTSRNSLEIDRLIAELIVGQNLSFSLVECPAFKRLMQIANPEYNIGTEDYYTSQLMDLIYPRVSRKIKLLLEEFSTISIAIDTWQADSKSVPLLSISAHGMDAEFNRIKVVLRCEAIETFYESHYVVNQVQATLAHWNLDTKSINCFISNNSYDLFLEVRHVPCASRTLDICVDELLKNVDVIVLLRKLKDIAKDFKTSISAREKLKEIQETLEQTSISIIGDIEGRWTTTYLMIERFIQLKQTLLMYTDSNLNVQDWQTLENCLAILKPFYETSQQLNDPDTCISSVIPLFHTLKLTLTMLMNNIKHGTRPIIQSVCDTLHYRVSDVEDNMNYILATYLDPRYKLKFFDAITKERIEEEILKLVLQKIDLPPKEAPEKHDNGESSQTGNQSIQERLRMFLDSDEDVEDCDEAIEQTSLKSLLFQYNYEKRIKTHNNPLGWWKSNAAKYGPLVLIAQEYLSIPAAIISYNLNDGLLFDPVKFNLDHKMAETILFVKYNLPLINFEY